MFCCVLSVMLSLSFCSLISVLAYSGLFLLLAATLARCYSYNMVRSGRKEAGYDALAKVAKFSLTDTCCRRGGPVADGASSYLTDDHMYLL